MKVFNKAIIPLLMALIGLVVIVFVLPLGVQARQAEPNQGEIVVNPQTPPGGLVQLSNGTGGSVPAIATGGSSAAVVYVKNEQVFLRWAQTMWAPAKLIDSVKGNVPKLAFLPGTDDTVHIVWTGYSGTNPQQVIRHVRCTMTTEPTINCGSINTIATAPANTVLESPDIVFDTDNHAHVAWFENPDAAASAHSIKSERSSAADPKVVGDWGGSPATENVVSAASAGQPALAASGNFVHLIFRDKPSDWSIEYRRSVKTSSPHVWVASVDKSFGEVSQHSKVSNPTIAAGGSRLYLAWDTQLDSDTTLYALIGVTNTNAGASTGWGFMREIDSDIKVDAGIPPTTDRQAKDDIIGTVPRTEAELRPSLGVDNTDFVAVWQERPDLNCHSSGGIVAGSHTNGTSEIYWAETQTDGWTSVPPEIVDENQAEYSIDPDIAIDSLDRRHFVYMKATGLESFNCHEGGDSGDYAIYYWGEITGKWPENDIYLPLILKNG